MERRRAPSLPDLDDEPDEVTGCTHRAYMGDPVAAKVKSLEADMGEMKGHFKGPSAGQVKGGMVYELVQEWHATKTWIKTLPAAVVVAGAVIGGVVWISMHSQSQSPSAQDIAREIVKAQQK